MQIVDMAGVSEHDYDPLTLKFDGWARASKKGGSEVPRPLPNEVDGQLSLFVGFHGTTENGLLRILRTNGGQLKVLLGATTCLSRASWHTRMLDRQTVTKLDTSSRKYARRAASMHVGSS